MKTILSISLFLFGIIASAQLKYKYSNPNLNIPDWLSNPNYIAENATEEISIDIEEIKLTNVDDINVVELRMYESEHTSGTTSIYLGTFNKNLNIINITEVANLTTSDWNWQGELSFEEIEPGIIKYYCVDLTYRPSENTESQDVSSGLELSNADTITSYFKIGKNGNISYSDDLNELKNGGSRSIEADIEEINENNDADQEKIIQVIRQVFAGINKNVSSYQKRERKSGNNIDLTYYYDKNILKKMSEVNSSNGQCVDYYFDKQNIVFIYAHNKIKNTESRYYFDNDVMIKWLKGEEKEEMSPTSDEFKTKGKELLSRSISLSQN